MLSNRGCGNKTVRKNADTCEAIAKGLSQHKPGKAARSSTGKKAMAIATEEGSIESGLRHAQRGVAPRWPFFIGYAGGGL
jgi:hypothetical protein